MQLFRIVRNEIGTWGDTIEVIVIAKDAKHAERRARIEFEDLRKAKLKVEKIEMDEEKVVTAVFCDEYEVYEPEG